MKFHLQTVVFQIINFVVLLFILRRVLYRPLRATMEKRREAIRAELAEAKRARDEAEALRATAAAEMTQLEKARVERLDALRSELEAERNRLIGQAREEADRVREKEQALLAARAREEQGRLGALAVEIVDRYARRLLADVADEELHRALVRRFLAGAGAVAGELAEEGAGAAPALECVFAWPPREMELATLRETFQAALGRPPGPIGVTVDRALIAGVRLKAGGKVFDASLAGQLAALTEKVADGG